MRIIYVIRRDKEYHEHNLLSDNFLKTWPDTKNIISIWNNTFNINWLEFRHLINKLRKCNAKDLKFDAQYYFYELESIDLSDCIVVPTDDDDWFHPDLFSILRELPKRHHYRWSYAEVIASNYYDLLPLTSANPAYTNNKLTIYPKKNHSKFYYLSNNYALYSPKDIELVNSHDKADLQFSPTDETIDKCLSIHLLHLSSVSFLTAFQQHKINLSELLSNLLEVYQKPIILPDNTPQYFLKYFDELIKIYKKLSLKRTFI